jgi:hypothetical protein
MQELAGLHREAHIENSMHETGKMFGPFRSFQLQAESGGCVVLSGHLPPLKLIYFLSRSRPDPKRRFMLSVAFALQRGNADMFARCNARRIRNRSENVYSLRLSSPEL